MLKPLAMKPRDDVVREKAAKAIKKLEEAKNILNGYIPDADEAIDEAIARLEVAKKMLKSRHDR